MTPQALLSRWRARRDVTPVPLFAPQPRSLWIELTSKCPFDCVFCSRKLLRGAGVHMDMRLYRRMLAELEAPEMIRLNYSGESTHHPQVMEAIRLAVATGAQTELVTALGSLPERLVEPLATSGLSRLTVSLHTLDSEAYRTIYGYSEVDDVRRKIDMLLAARDRSGAVVPALDLAVVAMRRNLGQLQPLADYAAQIGATGLAIHPVIRRDAIADRFEDELDGERLRPEFLADLAHQVAELRRLHPRLSVSVSTPELEGAAQCLGETPSACPGPLPPGARIHSCEQNPWDTVHVLADGSVVSCEVRDRLPLGRVSADPAGPGLVDVWAGGVYAEFRRQFRAGSVQECRSCPYKTVFLPGPPAAAIEATAGAHAQLLHGWHPADGSGVLWAKRTAALMLARPPGVTHLRLGGVVPATVGRVDVEIDGKRVGALLAEGDQASWVEGMFSLPAGHAAMVGVTLFAARAVVPARAGMGPDLRELGFGLQRAGLV
jgi:MoaA/NifB/PqqE/SkfB family radical SAM enzyme